MRLDLTVRVPGVFDGSGVMIDLETRKVATAAGTRHASGEPLRSRWSIVMAGVAKAGVIRLLAGDSEPEMLKMVSKAVGRPEYVAYAGTREFDEMICRGRFTNARRAHARSVMFPAVPGAECWNWWNVWKATKNGATLRTIERAADIPSREVPDGILDGRGQLVRIHLLRDVVELIVAIGGPDDECLAWCVKVLESNDFALCALAIARLES
jgi:hypothetical protein